MNENEKNKPNEDIPLRRRSLQGPDNLTQQAVLKKKFKCIKTYTHRKISSSKKWKNCFMFI